MAFFGLFSKEKKETLNKGLEKTKQSFFSKIARSIVGKSKVDDEVLDNLEEILITSDVGVDTTLKVIERIEERVARDKVLGVNELNTVLKEEIASLLSESNNGDAVDFELPNTNGEPYVIMVVGVNGVQVYLDKALSGAASGVTTFYKSITEDITLGMGVTHTNAGGETNALPEGTTVTGIDEKNGVVYLSNALLNNIQVATGDEVTFNSSKVIGTAHGLEPGDVIYIAAGTGNTTTTSSTYTVFETPDADTFTLSPALDGVGNVTLYSSIFFAERFTNGPYNVQNNGDQIKVTLNVSLD